MSTLAPQVLVPIDFSEQSLIALDHSHNLAKFYNAELTLLYVIEKRSAFIPFLKKHTHETNEKEIGDRLKELAATVSKKHNINTNTIITVGRDSDEILKIANEIDAKLTIMGSSGAAKNLRKKFTGDKLIRVVREAKCPVITVKGKNVRDGCKNIVMPIDLTKESREKVKNAIELGKLYGATINVISVLYTIDKYAINRLTKQVDDVKKTIMAAGVNCTTEIISVVKAIEPMENVVIRYANKIEADLLLIMTQQEGEMKPLFIGSTAQNIIDNSDVPVMSIVPASNKRH